MGCCCPKEKNENEADERTRYVFIITPLIKDVKETSIRLQSIFFRNLKLLTQLH